jgi:hypothetical protein
VRPHEGPIPRSAAVQPRLPEVRRTITVFPFPRGTGKPVLTGTRRLCISWVGGGPPLRLEPSAALEYSAQGSPLDRVGRHARVAA